MRASNESIGHGQDLARTFRAALLASAVWGCAGAAWADQAAGSAATQEPNGPAPAAGANHPVEVEEIVVTALKRSTTLQKTPISISAVTGENLSNAGVTDIIGLAKSAPSLSFVNNGPGNRRVVIRGIQAAGEPTVGLYYDETPVSGSVGSTNDAGGTTPELKLFDVERVEVLRGPQGTLYGSGSMGGTVRVIYQKPTYHYEAAMDASVMGTDGGDASYLVQGMVNIPIIEDKLAIRAVAFDQDRGGYVDNVFLGQKNINEEQTSGGRVLLRFQPNERFTLDASAFYQSTDASSPTWNPAAGAYNSTSQAQLPIHDRLQLYSLTGQYDLGPVIATGVVSYYKRDLDQASADVSYYIGSLIGSAPACAKIFNAGAACSPATQAAFDTHVRQNTPSILYPQQTTDNLTAEFRLSSNTHSRLDWTVGGYYSDRTGHVNNSEINVDPATGAALKPFVYDTTRLIDDELKQIAGFGEASFHVTDKLTLTAGARYFHYDKDVGGETTIPLDLVGARVTPYTKLHSDEDGWVTKFNASYQVTDNVMAYAEAAQGFRPGGVNQVLGLATALTPYESDSLWNYEVGLKTASLNNRLIFNIDAYRIDWSNMQVTGTTPNGAFRFIANAGAARINGIEADATFMPIAGLEIQANAAYTDAKLSEDQVNANVSAAGRAGDRIPYIPQFSGGVSAQYTFPLGDSLSGLARADLNYVGTSYSEFRPDGPFYRRIGAYSLTNLRAGVQSDSGGWGVYLFLDNAFNKEAITYATASAISTGQTLVVSATPRTIGVNIRKHF